MELLKKFKVVIALVLIVLILVVIRSTGVNHFRNDAKKWALTSFNQANTINPEQANLLKGKTLIINLDKNIKFPLMIAGELKNISPDSVLSRMNIKTIVKHSAGQVLLYSSEQGLSARIWMILSQMGCKNLFILTSDTDNEVFKYKFRPDTMLN
jgi:hypothetical protein